MPRSPEHKKTRPTPSLGPLGAILQFPGSDSLFCEDFCFWFFPHKFWHFCLGMHLNLPDSAQKKFWRPNFLKILTFYFVKLKPLALTRRVKKSTLLHTQCYIWHQNMKQNFISDLLIPFFFRPGASKGFWSHFSIFFPRFLHFLPFLSPQKPPSVFPYTRCTKNFLPPPLDTLGVLRDT